LPYPSEITAHQGASALLAAVTQQADPARIASIAIERNILMSAPRTGRKTAAG
jgi:hypothetical protein